MPLDPQVQTMREKAIAAGTPPLYTLSIDEARAADLAAIQAAAGTGEPVHEVIDGTLPGPAGDLPIRTYRPLDTADPLPTLIYFFGGGWTLGNIDTSDAICRSLANAVPCQVITIGYRLAPEHKFPAAVNDSYAATRWIAHHAEAFGADPARLAVAGDSAGGNLAAVVCQLSRSAGPALAAQVLIYPNTDYRGATESMRTNDDPTLFNRRSVAWYWSHYLSTPDEGLDPRVSPLLADDLSGLPPALVITAEYDPLRDEGEAYAGKLRAAGVPVESTRYDGMVHGFVAMAGVLDGGRQAIDQAARYLRERFGVEVP
jgi:acetyl esterase